MPKSSAQPQKRDTTINHLALLNALKTPKGIKQRDTTVNHLALLKAVKDVQPEEPETEVDI